MSYAIASSMSHFSPRSLFLPNTTGRKQGVIRLWINQVRRIERHSHENTGNDTSARKSEDPSQEDLAKLLPVYRLQVAVGEGDTDDGTSDTLGS